MIELELIKKYPQEMIAVDEVGRGPLCGPVVVGAVCLEVTHIQGLKSLLKDLKSKGIGDSKKMSQSKRQQILNTLGMKLLDFRREECFQASGLEIRYLTWEMDHEVIDQENILGASLRAMKEATISLSMMKKNHTTVLIDGPKKFRWDKESPFNEIPIIKGDQRSLLIGLASILAKEKRDEFMRQMHELYPMYGINSHSGYPTKAHKEAIQKFGPGPIHRKTFKGVKEFVI